MSQREGVERPSKTIFLLFKRQRNYISTGTKKRSLNRSSYVTGLNGFETLKRKRKGIKLYHIVYSILFFYYSRSLHFMCVKGNTIFFNET
jgi:hypothetical protein